MARHHRAGAGRAAAASLVLAGAAAAGEANYQPFVVGERAAGMGGAVAATAEGMDACFYNPAGLAGESRNSISVNGTLYGIQNFETKDAAFPGEDFNISSFATIPTGLSAVRRLGDGMAAAFSVFVPSQSSAREIQAFPANEHYYNYSYDEEMLLLGPSLGRAVNERVSVGASVFGVYQTASEFENLYWGDYAYSYSSSYKYSVMGVIGTVGALVRLSDGWSAALTATTPSLTLGGEGSIQVSEVQGHAEAAGAGAVYYDGLDADNGLPGQVRIGLGWRRPEVGSAGLDVTHHFPRDFDWMDGSPNGDRVTIRQERESVTDVQIGGEIIVRKRYPVRAGFFTSFSSAPDLNTADTSTPNQVDLYGVTASVGSVGENTVLNFGVSYVFGDGDAFGTRLDAAGDLESVVTDTRERSLYVFASTAYRF